MSTQKVTVIEPTSSAGFSLVETIVAMFVIMISMLGTLQAINYSIIYNAGNATRAQNLAILQQEVERLRSAKFTPSGIDSWAPPGTGACRTDAQRDIRGGTDSSCIVDAPNGAKFIVRTCVDNNPFNAPGTCDNSPADPPNADPTAITRIKEITVEVSLAIPSPGWQTAVPARAVLRRTIGN